MSKKRNFRQPGNGLPDRHLNKHQKYPQTKKKRGRPKGTIGLATQKLAREIERLVTALSVFPPFPEEFTSADLSEYLQLKMRGYKKYQIRAALRYLQHQGKIERLDPMTWKAVKDTARSQRLAASYRGSIVRKRCP